MVMGLFCFVLITGTWATYKAAAGRHLARARPRNGRHPPGSAEAHKLPWLLAALSAAMDGMRTLRLAAENTALESTPSETKARAVWGPGSKNLQSG